MLTSDILSTLKSDVLSTLKYGVVSTLASGLVVTLCLDFETTLKIGRFPDVEINVVSTLKIIFFNVETLSRIEVPRDVRTSKGL